MENEISYNQYIKALNIVLQYHSQILKNDIKVQVSLDNSKGTVLLADFLKSLNNVKYYNSIKKYWHWTKFIEFEDCSVEYYLKLLETEVGNGRYSDSFFRGLGNESIKYLFDTLSLSNFQTEFLYKKVHLTPFWAEQLK